MGRARVAIRVEVEGEDSIATLEVFEANRDAGALEASTGPSTAADTVGYMQMSLTTSLAAADSLDAAWSSLPAPET